MPSVSRIGDADNKGDILVAGSPTVFAGNVPIFTDIQVTMPQEYSVSFATPVIQAAGKFAALDDPSSITFTPNDYPDDQSPSTDDGSVKDQSDAQSGSIPTGDLSPCSNISLPINYDQSLTANFSIGDLSRDALFSHEIVSQLGFSEQEIVCNLKGLSEKILEPVLSEYGNFRINSGFRKGPNDSQHNKGMAVDIQEPSWTIEKHFEVAEWIANNLVFDQLIVEHGSALWIHISFDRNKDMQRGELLTMYKGNFEQGLKLYY